MNNTYSKGMASSPRDLEIEAKLQKLTVELEKKIRKETTDFEASIRNEAIRVANEATENMQRHIAQGE